MKKLSRTISGVTPVAVMTRPMKCPGRCIYCPDYAATPRSYTPESPAVLSAIRCDYDVGEQIERRLKILTGMGHPVDKIELIIMGGTFLAYPADYQYRFIKDCYDALNGTVSATLEEAKRFNETSNRRCVGLCLETRPDWCGQAEIDRMLDFGTTRVELGVQTLDDGVYKLVGRGHSVADVAQATKILREHGLKVHYHWMPGLPGTTPGKDLEMSARLFQDSRFRPDGLKLYPTMVVAGTELEKWYLEGRYRPYDAETMLGLILDIKSIVPRYVRISRVLREIPSKFIVAGPRDSMRDVVKQRMEQRGVHCQCIRCREYGHRIREGWTVSQPQLKRMDYPASGGGEVFLSYEDKQETLFGLLRMRIQTKPIARLETEINGNLALIRELHIYGPEVSLGQREPTAVQHKGLGRGLLREAERIAKKEFKSPIMAILSGVGAREYYRSEFGYQLKAGYMVKEL